MTATATKNPQTADSPFIQFLSDTLEKGAINDHTPLDRGAKWYEEYEALVESHQEEGMDGFNQYFASLQREHPYLMTWLCTGNPTQEEKRLPRGTTLSDVVPKPIRWLWPGRLALGKLHMFDGDGGIGKSLLMHEIAARLTSGRPMPYEDKPLVTGGVVIVGMEEDLEDTVQPRLARAGAKLDRIIAIGDLTDWDYEGKEYKRPFMYPGLASSRGRN